MSGTNLMDIEPGGENTQYVQPTTFVSKAEINANGGCKVWIYPVVYGDTGEADGAVGWYVILSSSYPMVM